MEEEKKSIRAIPIKNERGLGRLGASLTLLCHNTCPRYFKVNMNA